MNVTQTALTIKSLCAHMSLADAVERTVPGADVSFWRKQVANLGKPRTPTSRSRTPRTGKTRQAAKQAAAMAALVARVNEQPEAPRVVARIERADYTAELLDNGTVRYV